MGQPNALRRYRERARLSRTRLGYLAGVDPQTIYRIENGAGTTVPTGHAIARALSEVLGEEVTTRDLFPEPSEASA